MHPLRRLKVLLLMACTCFIQNVNYADGPDTPLEFSTTGLYSIGYGPFLASGEVYRAAKRAKDDNISDYSTQWAYNSAIFEVYGSIFLGAASITAPIEIIKNFPHLSKANLSLLEHEQNNNTQPVAQLSLSENGQTKTIAIPLKLNPHLIQMNQKLDDKPYENI